MSKTHARRIVVLGATGHLGQQVIDQLDETGWPVAELIGVASAESAGTEFEFRGELLDVVSEWPVLKGRDLVLICTPQAEALEVVREALRAEVPCIDCTGAVGNQEGVPMPPSMLFEPRGNAADLQKQQDDLITKAPLLAVPSGTTLAWSPIVDALPVTRIVATVMSSVSSHGRRGVEALSAESIALFNQSDSPSPGPAGQPVAYDVIPGGGIDCDRVRRESRRLFGESLRIDLASVQVPTFVGEGASLSIELSEPLRVDELEARLAMTKAVVVVRDGLGTRGLVAVEDEVSEPIGPTLRDSIGADSVLVGRIEADRSLPEGVGWRLWLSFDPLRLTAAQALMLAGRRLGLA